MPRLLAQAGVPAEYQYDVAPKPKTSVAPVYPYALMAQDARGTAKVRFAVDATGKVIFADVIAADRPEFGAALQAAIEGTEFEPALKAGKPTQSLLTLDREFSTYDDDHLVKRDDRRLFQVEQKHPEKIVSPGKLDAKLRPTETRAPTFPLALDGKVVKAEALVEMLVDPVGVPRLARVISASNPAFGWSAVQAVSQWRFEKPKSGGKEAVVRVRVPFNFNGKPAK
ncbi:MAG: TonB family protein [Verrucomicrobia bacterium]|nr:TonB family protein [Verrucomicrobiota bacterium]